MPDPDAADERLEALGKQIDEAREHAEDAIPVLEDDERRFVDRGDVRSDEDDETIPPPG